MKLILTICLSITVAAACAATNPFDTDPGWSGTGNTTSGNNFGYRATTTSAGGQAGEMGGTLARTDVEGSYVDATVGDFTLANPLEVTGKISIGNTVTWDGVAQIGYRSANVEDASFLGLEIMEQDGEQVRIRASLLRNEGGAAASAFSTILTGAYTLKLTYDPNGGANSQGVLTITLSNSSISHNLMLDLTEADRTATITLNAFGIASPNLPNPDPAKTVDIFLDDLSYTAK